MAWDAATVRAWLWRALKAYGLFAVAHSLIKTVSLALRIRRYQRHLNQLPGPSEGIVDTQKKVLKNMHRLHDLRLEMVAPYREEELICMPGWEVACNSEDSVKWLLKDEFKSITKLSQGQDYLIYMLGQFIGTDGIFILRHGAERAVGDEHQAWLFQRKTASTIFTKNQFSHFMGGVFTDKADRMVDVMGRAADADDKLDAQRLFFAFTMDSIQKIFFNRDVNSVEADEVDPYAQAFDTAHVNLTKFVFPHVPLIIASVEVLPWPFGTIFDSHDTNWSMRLARKLSRSGRAFDENVAFIHKETHSFVQQTRRDPDLAKRDDLLALIMNAPGGKDLSDTTLAHIVLNFIIAGRDTTACTLTWMFFELTQNPEVQRKLQAEIDEKLGGRNPTLEDLDPQNMPYLNGVMYEALRLHPPVPEDIKVTTRDLTFKGRFIPKDTRLIFIPYSMGRDPNRYPDPLKFDPERWIPFEQPSDFAFPVFQAGNRFCLGRHMAQFEAKLLASKLLQQFSFTLEPGEADKISYAMMVTMSLKNGRGDNDTQLWLRPQRRHA